MLKTIKVKVVGISYISKNGKQCVIAYARDINENDISTDNYILSGYKTYNFFIPKDVLVELGQEVTICLVEGKYEYLQL